MHIPRPLGWLFLTVPWIVALFVLLWLILLRFPPSGVSTFSFAFDGRSPWFDPFLPGQRVTSPGPQPDGWVGQRILVDPVYASARLPGAFDRLRLTLEARTIRQPVVEMGILRDQASFSFEMQPVWSEALSHGWRETSWCGRHGFVRASTMDDDDLCQTDPNVLMVWHATTTEPAWMDTPAPEKTWEVSLRGGHDLYVVPVNGEIRFRLAVQDLNRTRGGNVIGFRLSHGDELVWTDAIGTSGSRDHRPEQVYEKTIEIKNLRPGVYHLALIADDDIFVRRITTTAKRWVFGPRLYFGDTVGYSTSTQSGIAWTNSRHLSLQTFHNEGIQTVSFGSKTLSITKTHDTFALDRLAGEMSDDRTVIAPKGDVRIIGDGYFALDRSALFLPSPRRLTDASDPAKEGILAVITPYHPPNMTFDGWMRLTATFTLPPSDDRPKFTLSAPGLFARNGAVDIRAAELVYERPPLSPREWWTYLRRELSAAWRRV